MELYTRYNSQDARVKYMKNNYPIDWETRTVTPFDSKMIHMLEKIHVKYSDHYNNRPHTVMIEKCSPKIEVPPPPPMNHVKTKTEKQPVMEIETCRAITIRTNSICGKKAKNGTFFCGIHCKK
jgi:hypothetical protein